MIRPPNLKPLSVQPVVPIHETNNQVVLVVMTPMAMTLGVATAIKAMVAKQADAASNVVGVVS